MRFFQVLLLALVFTAISSYAANVRPPYLSYSCFSTLDIKIDHHHNLFAFLQNSDQRKKCQNLKSMPYHYVSLEIYRLNAKLADAIYHQYRTRKSTFSLLKLFSDLHKENIVCTHRGDTLFWPSILYLGCARVA